MKLHQYLDVYYVKRLKQVALRVVTHKIAVIFVVIIVTIH